jgi:alpha-tubulin suppressor-like RCC1 family protein
MSLRRPNGFISAGYDPLEVPNAPTIGVASIASATSVSVTFTAPSNVGGSAITGYVATAKKTSDGTTISGTGSSSPVTISGLTTGDAYTVTVAAVNSFGLGVSSAASNSVTPLDSELYSWGDNETGRLGLNDTADRSSPVQIGSLTTWRNMSAGSQAAFVTKTDGTLWAWGRNNVGQLGINQDSYANRSSPVQIGALTTWVRASTVSLSASALSTNGSLWTWGFNYSGQLGLSDTSNRSSPVQVGGLTNWAQVSMSSASCIAIKTDGTLWAWGSGQNGRLGLNNTTDYSSPKQVGSLTNWSKVSAAAIQCLAIKTDGTLWAWGYNNYGQLGLNDTVSRSSPVQVGSLTNWFSVSSGNAFCSAIKTDGTLWAWGSNTTDGNLGLSDTVNRSSPVQVGALTNWAKSSSGVSTKFCFAIKTDSTLWSWGVNNDGQLGDSTVVRRSSPVQVGSLSTWQEIESGGTSTFGIKG